MVIDIVIVIGTVLVIEVVMVMSQMKATVRNVCKN